MHFDKDISGGVHMVSVFRLSVLTQTGGGGPTASCSDIVAVLYSASRFLAPPLQERPEDWRPERKWLLRYRPLLADLADASR